MSNLNLYIYILSPNLPWAKVEKLTIWIMNQTIIAIPRMVAFVSQHLLQTNIFHEMRATNKCTKG